MGNRIITSCAACLAVAGLVGASSAETEASILVRPAVNGRIWQVNLTPSDPIRWAWAMGSDAARLTITNLTTGAISDQVIARADGDLFGSYALSMSAEPLEQVCTLAVEQYYHYGLTDQKTIESATARIAYLPGIHGAAIDVGRVRRTYLCDRTAVISYDAAWASGSLSATNATLTSTPRGGAASVRTLDGTSGYDVVTENTDCNLALAFDGVTYWTRLVRFGHAGLLFLIH